MPSQMTRHMSHVVSDYLFIVALASATREPVLNSQETDTDVGSDSRRRTMEVRMRAHRLSTISRRLNLHANGAAQKTLQPRRIPTLVSSNSRRMRRKTWR